MAIYIRILFAILLFGLTIGLVGGPNFSLIGWVIAGSTAVLIVLPIIWLIIVLFVVLIFGLGIWISDSIRNLTTKRSSC